MITLNFDKGFELIPFFKYLYDKKIFTKNDDELFIDSIKNNTLYIDNKILSNTYRKYFKIILAENKVPGTIKKGLRNSYFYHDENDNLIPQGNTYFQKLTNPDYANNPAIIELNTFLNNRDIRLLFRYPRYMFSYIFNLRVGNVLTTDLTKNLIEIEKYFKLLGEVIANA